MYHLRTGLYNVSIGTMLNQLSGMNRRQALQLGLGSLAGFSYVLPPSPEVSNVPAPGPPPPRLEGHDLQPVAIDPALDIRTITGLRPLWFAEVSTTGNRSSITTGTAAVVLRFPGDARISRWSWRGMSLGDPAQ